MKVRNAFIDDSFRYKEDKTGNYIGINERKEELENLSKVVSYCNKIREDIFASESVFYCEVIKGLKLCDALYAPGGNLVNDDVRRLLLEMIDKGIKTMYDEIPDADNEIQISLGRYNEAAYDMVSYVEKRRRILKKIKNAIEYSDFMVSCFPNSVFSKTATGEMRYISDFSDNTEEITNALSVLDDKAVSLYKKYTNDLKVAMKELTALIAECSNDPNHRKKLSIEFIYEDLIDDRVVKKTKSIRCEPHLKLIRRDSDLRIYFYWADKDVGKGEKVLIGRIGRHPK